VLLQSEAFLLPPPFALLNSLERTLLKRRATYFFSPSPPLRLPLSSANSFSLRLSVHFLILFPLHSIAAFLPLFFSPLACRFSGGDSFLFSINRDTFFGPEDLLRTLSRASSILLVSEHGVSLPLRLWQSFWAVLFRSILLSTSFFLKSF